MFNWTFNKELAKHWGWKHAWMVPETDDGLRAMYCRTRKFAREAKLPGEKIVKVML